MATSRDWCSHTTPPPPYEGDDVDDNHLPMDGQIQRAFRYHNSANRSSDRDSRNQTIPKLAEVQQSEMMPRNEPRVSNSKVDHQKQQVDELNKRHTCLSRAQHTNPAGKQAPQAPTGDRHNDGHEQFVNSLAAPRRLLGQISIEPLAFLAVLALYIEFPAIQDLIYTKICLEVLAKHPNLTITQEMQVAQTIPLLTSDRVSNSTTFTLNNATEWLPSNGRIRQESTSNISQLIIPTNDLNSHSHGNNHHDPARQQHLLCDRLNKTAVPREIRQEILDVDSLFWLKYQIVICSLSALASPYWGGLSDRIGRLIPLNAPILSAVLHNLISLTFGLLISLDSHSMFHINWLYLGAVIVGLSGGQAVLIMNAFSFISDNTTSDERSKRVTVLESVVFVAHSVGFFLSKMIMLLGLASPERPWLNRHFVAFAACILLNLICILYSIKELRHHKFHRFLNNFEREQQETAILGSDTPYASGSTSSLTNGSKRDGGCCSSRCSSSNNNNAEIVAGHLVTGERLRELTSSTPDDPDGPIARSDKTNWTFWDSVITFRYYKETFEIATKPRETRSIILLLLLSGFISALSLAALMSLFFIYVKMDPFNWTTSQYSSWNSTSSITRGIALVALTLLMKFTPAWNVPDPIVAGIGFLAKGAGLLMIGQAQSSSVINWSLVAFTFSEYSMPPIRSLLSKLVIRDELCKIYSCLGALQSLCFILGNIAFYVAFTSYAQQDFFRISFLVVGGIEFAAVLLVLIIYTAVRRQILVI